MNDQNETTESEQIEDDPESTTDFFKVVLGVSREEFTECIKGNGTIRIGIKTDDLADFQALEEKVFSSIDKVSSFGGDLFTIKAEIPIQSLRVASPDGEKVFIDTESPNVLSFTANHLQTIEIPCVFWPEPDGGLAIVTADHKGFGLDWHAPEVQEDKAFFLAMIRERNERLGLKYPALLETRAAILEQGKAREVQSKIYGPEKRKRGKALPTFSRLLIGCSEAAQATNAGITKVHEGKMTDRGFIVENPARNNLDFRLAVADAMTPDDFLANTQRLTRGIGALSLKALGGAVRAWAEQTGATRYDEYAEVSLGILMKASGLKSKPNSELQRTYLRSFLPLTQSWVEVPSYRYDEGKPTRDKKRWQGVLISDQITLVRGLFAEDPDFRNDEVWDLRYHLGEFLFSVFFGKDKGSKQFIEVSERLLEYDANRQGDLIKLGFYFGPQLRMNRGKAEVMRTGPTIINGAGLTPEAKNLGRWTGRLIENLQRLERDQVLPCSIEIEDPGGNVSPKKRLDGLRVRLIT